MERMWLGRKQRKQIPNTVLMCDETFQAFQHNKVGGKVYVSNLSS